MSNNSNRCEGCGEFVTDEEMAVGDGVDCKATSIEGGRGCDQRSHTKCVDFCSECGYLCESEIGDYLECNSCGMLHDPDHFVSYGSDFVDQFGLICESCFYKDEDEFHVDLPHWKVGTWSEDEEEADKKYVDDFVESKKKEAKKKKVKLQVPLESKTESSLSEKAYIDFAQATSRKRADQSTYLSHFVKKREGMTEDDCFNQLVEIIQDKKLEARATGYFSVYNRNVEQTRLAKSVCLTEGRLSALKDHADQYSYFGIGLGKYKLMRDFQCAPCIYINQDTIKIVRDKMPDELVPYVNKISVSGGIDYHHEREWRCPEDVTFEHQELNFIFAPKKFHDKILNILDVSRPVYCISSLIEL